MRARRAHLGLGACCDDGLLNRSQRRHTLAQPARFVTELGRARFLLLPCMMQRPGTWVVLWLLGSCLPCGCYSTQSETSRERSTAATAGSPAAAGGSLAPDPCPVRPLAESDVCVVVGSLPGGTSSALPTCPRGLGDARDLSCRASITASPCGGAIVTVPEGDPDLAWMDGYVEYHYDADNVLIGVLEHVSKATGCAANRRYGKTCAVVAPKSFPRCAPPTSSSVQR